MRDKSLEILLMVLFGIGGIIILVLTWSQTMLFPERILSTSIGSIGLVWATARALLLRTMSAKMAVERIESQNTADHGKGERSENGRLS